VKKILSLLMILVLGTSCSDLQKILESGQTGVPLSQADIVNGLKEALETGAIKSGDFLSVRDGFYRSSYKILLPEEARVVTDRLKIIPGFAEVEEVLIERINRAAEDAAQGAKPIFIQAIRQLSIQDGMNILMGEDNEATLYLQRQTRQALYNQFNPVIVQSLNKFNALDYWADAVNTYNQIPLISKVNPRLEDHITNMALNALFDRMEKEELRIRRNVQARTSELLRRVFARQDGNRKS
jgi:hypothetical protein